MIELVDFNEIYGKGKVEKKEGAKRTRRAGGSRKKAAAEPTATEASVTNETPAADAAPEAAEGQPS